MRGRFFEAFFSIPVPPTYQFLGNSATNHFLLYNIHPSSFRSSNHFSTFFYSTFKFYTLFLLCWIYENPLEHFLSEDKNMFGPFLNSEKGPITYNGRRAHTHTPITMKDFYICHTFKKCWIRPINYAICKTIYRLHSRI